MARQRNSSSITEDLGLPTCSICHSVMEEDISISPCSHSFCTPCISRWLERKSECPICKKSLYTPQLIRNRELPELVKKIKEMRSNIPNLANATGDSPQGHTRKLLQMKESKISRLKDSNESSGREIQHLKGEVTRLKAEIHSIPTLKEKIKQLEAGLTKERRHSTDLRAKLEDSAVKEASLRNSVNLSKKSKYDLEKKEVTYLKQMQKKTDDLEHLKSENNRLTLEVSKLEGDLEAECVKLGPIQEENEYFKALLQSLEQKNRDLSVELEKTKYQAGFLWNRANQLMMYEQYCKEKDQILDSNCNILSNRNQTIDKLQADLKHLVEVQVSLRQDTIPLKEHTVEIQTEVQQTKDNLQESYETARDTAKAYEEENKKTWRKRLTALESQLKSQEEINELSTATKTYKHLVRENTELQNTVSQLRQSLNERMMSFGEANE